MGEKAEFTHSLSLRDPAFCARFQRCQRGFSGFFNHIVRLSSLRNAANDRVLSTSDFSSQPRRA